MSFAAGPAAGLAWSPDRDQSGKAARTHTRVIVPGNKNESCVYSPLALCVIEVAMCSAIGYTGRIWILVTPFTHTLAHLEQEQTTC